MFLNLTGRQQNILVAIVLDYIATADPVGSRTIAKKYELGLSPATIRNDMAELEEKGLLVQPHLSAGRIPSELGYRSFVDFLMEKAVLSNEEIQKINTIGNSNNPNLDFIIEQSGRVLSALSQSVSIIKFPEATNEYIKHFQVLPINETMFLIILVSNTGKVTDYKIKSDSPIDERFFTHITNYFNEQLVGTPINNLKNKLSSIIRNNTEFSDIIQIIYDNMGKFFENRKSKFKVLGTSNILKTPEFTEKDKAQSLLDFFEEEDHSEELSEIMNVNDENGGTKILIGKEIKIQRLQDCSMIVSSYKINDYIEGAIGILGPTRMDYSKSVATIEEMTNNLSKLVKDIFGLR